MAHEGQGEVPSAKVSACTRIHRFGVPYLDSRSTLFFLGQRPIVQIGRGSALPHDPRALSNQPATPRYVLPMTISEGLRLDT